jgi:hypothetical protein
MSPSESTEATAASTLHEQAIAAHLDLGTAGGSAQAEADRRQRKFDKRIAKQWGELAGIAKFFEHDPPAAVNWAKGADGERRAATFLDHLVGEHGLVLSDRAVPGRDGNIDHLAVVPSGVWVVDAKNYVGQISTRPIEWEGESHPRLFIDDRDHTALVHGLSWQLKAVRQALGSATVSITAALLFIDGEWAAGTEPFVLHDVLVGPPGPIATQIRAPGQLSDKDIFGIATVLAKALPSK